MIPAPPDLSWGAIAPQIILTGGAILLLVGAMASRALWGALPWLALVVLAAAGGASWGLWGRGGPAFWAMVTGDDVARYGTLVFVLAAGLTVLLSMERPGGREREPDYYPLVLLATAGMSFLAASINLVSFLLSLEILSVSLYVLMGTERRKPEATEAAVKYFLLGAFATAFAVYGTALIYGGAGTTALAALAARSATGGAAPGHPALLLAGLALLTVGLGFKISMVPFHAWTPDVYQGAATPVTAFLSTGSKAAVFVVILRVFGLSFRELRLDWVGLIAALSLVTMLVGNITALRQWDVKRLLAFSSIAHVGYLLSGVAAGATDGGSGVLFYLAGYTAMNLTAFGVVVFLERDLGRPVSIANTSGLASRRPLLAAAMAIALFSLAGVPPTVGFVAKFYLFRAAVRADLTWLAVAGVLNSVVSLYYYLRIVVHMYMRPAEGEVAPKRPGIPETIALVFSVLLILVLGIFPDPVLRLAQAAAALIG